MSSSSSSSSERQGDFSGSVPEDHASSPGGPHPPGEDPEARARALCMRMLTHSPRTRAQLEQALYRRDFEEDVITSVLGEFGAAGLVDDAAFAEAWVSSRHHSRRLSRRALTRELRTRGVEEETVREAVEELTDEDEVAAAHDLARRSLTGSRDRPTQTRVRRALGALARKGYPEGLAFRVVREELESEGVEVDLYAPDS